MRISVILVHYQTPALAQRAVSALRADLPRTGLPGEILIVDNGSDSPGSALLASLEARTIDPGQNLGFAGGVNRGVREARGDLLLVMNPDVEVLPGCLGALVAALEGGAEIGGPRFYWDRERRFLLPPTERRTRRDELATTLAGRGEGWARRARSRWRNHARRHWQATEPLPSHALSGGLLAFRRSAWMANGPFDEGYRLYFEETDWLLRAADRGLPALYLPAAEALHAVGASSEREPQAQRWFEESAARFRRRRYGTWFARPLEQLAGRGSREAGPATGVRRAALAAPFDLAPYRSATPPLWIELAPSPTGLPATAERLGLPLATPPPRAGAPSSSRGPSLRPTLPESWSLPEDLLRRWRSGPLYLRLVDGAGDELATLELTPKAVAAAEASQEPRSTGGA